MTPILLSLLLAQGLPIKDSDSSTLLQLDGDRALQAGCDALIGVGK